MYYTILLVVVIILSCQRQGGRKKEDNLKSEVISSPHIGVWEMIYYQSIIGNDTTILISKDFPLAITLLTPTHFSYHWRNSSNSGAGTYSYDGKIIRQEFKYVQDSNFVGAILSFKMDIKNDSLIFSGPVDAVSSSGENLMNYIPQMLEIRKRAE